MSELKLKKQRAVLETFVKKIEALMEQGLRFSRYCQLPSCDEWGKSLSHEKSILQEEEMPSKETMKQIVESMEGVRSSMMFEFVTTLGNGVDESYFNPDWLKSEFELRALGKIGKRLETKKRVAFD